MNTSVLDMNTNECLDGEDEMESLFASILVKPPRWLDERILAMAHRAVQVSHSELVEPRLRQAQAPARLRRSPPPWRQDRFLALAAADGNTRKNDKFISEAGDWSLHTTFNPDNPEQKSVRLYFQGQKAQEYEGRDVELYRGEDLVLSGKIRHGQIRAKIPADMIITPPFVIYFD